MVGDDRQAPVVVEPALGRDDRGERQRVDEHYLGEVEEDARGAGGALELLAQGHHRRDVELAAGDDERPLPRGGLDHELVALAPFRGLLVAVLRLLRSHDASLVACWGQVHLHIGSAL